MPPPLPGPQASPAGGGERIRMVREYLDVVGAVVPTRITRPLFESPSIRPLCLEYVDPQWTPVAGNCPEWMELGFSLFEALVKTGASVHEVFPSASYSMLEGERHPPVSIDFSAFRPGKTDMIDACIAAYTMIEFDQGRGCEVGDDGLGTIVLPRALSERIPVELLQYPG